ncbi:venom serine carboxypeptidase-like [Planococcus citri]|uniref:venom serine carboxypeptidase-like n=1 Tax=Planococcus citri TaxID=170843 RepID=UPI0031F941ED
MFRLLHMVCFLIPRCLCTSEVIMDPENPSKSKESSLVKSFFNDTISYAGFFDIRSTEFNDKLFFWFFPHRNENAAIIVWIQGQPGLSSLYSLFEEHGPYEISESNMQLTRRKYALTNTYHVLYLDPEIYCGFSYTNGPDHLYSEVDHVPAHIFDILKEFFLYFPEYRNNDLYVAGASANCQIICKLAHQIMNDFSNDKLNLKGLIIGGGLFSPQRSFHYRNTLHWNGIVDSALTFTEFRRKHYNILRFIQAKKHLEAMEEIGSMLSKVKRQGFQTLYDIRDAESMVNSFVPGFVTRSDIRDALHVSNLTFHNETQLIIKDSLLSAKELYSTIFSKYRILLYHGQFDLLSSYTHSAEFLVTLSWPYLEQYYFAKRINWMHNGELLGYWTKAGKLTHAMIRNAGHFVGKSQPEALNLLFENFIEDKFTRIGHQGI